MQFDSTNKPIGIKRIRLAFKNSQRAFTWLAKHESACLCVICDVC